MSELIHLEPVVKVLAGPFHPYPRCEVVSVAYAVDGLRIKVRNAGVGTEVVFPVVYGFRMLDELDLCEFWTQCSMKTGWLFEVIDGGWKALEHRRAHFVSGHLHDDLREFLVIGLTGCVSVLSKEEPQLQT